jgi:integrase
VATAGAALVTVHVRQSSKGWVEYHIRHEHPDGTRIEERRKSKFQPSKVITLSMAISDTLRWATKREADLLAQGPEHARPTTQTLADFYPEFKRLHFPNGPRGPLKPTQRRNIESDWRVHIEPTLGDRLLMPCPRDACPSCNHIGPLAIAEFIEVLQRPYDKDEPDAKRSLKTVNNVLATLNTMLAKAEEWKRAKDLPRAKLFKLDRPKVDFYDFEPFERLLDGARRAGPKQLAVVLLGARAGLRAGEILGLAPRDIDYKRKAIHVQRSIWKGKVGRPKNGKARWQPVTQQVLDALKAVPVVGAERFFVRDPGRYGRQPATIETLRLWVHAAERNAGIATEARKGQIHKLRHTYASHLVMRGVAVAVVQLLMDHENIQTTMRYAHLAPREIDRAVAVLEAA